MESETRSCEFPRAGRLSPLLATLATILATTLIITSLKIAMNGLKKEGWPTPRATTRPTADGSGGRTLQYLSGGQADGQDLALPVSDGQGLGRGLRARHRVDDLLERNEWTRVLNECGAPQSLNESHFFVPSPPITLLHYCVSMFVFCYHVVVFVKTFVICV